MKELLKKIFNNVISQEEDAIKILKHVDEEIDKLIEPYKEQFSDEQLEEIKDLMYGTALIAEQEGFQLGIFYAIKLLLFYQKM